MRKVAESVRAITIIITMIIISLSNGSFPVIYSQPESATFMYD